MKMTKKAMLERDELLREIYIHSDMTPIVIAKETNWGIVTVRKALRTIPGYPLRQHYKESVFNEHALYYALYHKLVSMKQRCYNPNCKRFKYYGAKQVTICDEWMDDWQVFAHWCLDNGYNKKGMAISRFGDKGNYSPDNCKITTMSENSKEMIENTGKKTPVSVYKDGLLVKESKSTTQAAEWFIENNIPKSKIVITVASRITNALKHTYGDNQLAYGYYVEYKIESEGK